MVDVVFDKSKLKFSKNTLKLLRWFSVFSKLELKAEISELGDL